jgi:hypothetical protein
LQSSSGQKLDRKKTDGKIDKEEVGRGGEEVGRVKKAMVEVPYNKGIEKFKRSRRGRLILGEERGRNGSEEINLPKWVIINIPFIITEWYWSWCGHISTIFNRLCTNTTF